ncbi:hypothetical protein [Clostridioides difficile]
MIYLFDVEEGDIMGYTHGIKWDDESIEKSILKVARSLQVHRMPSNEEIKSVMGNYSLSNKISRSGGFKYWASKLNLDMKNSETKLGTKWEFHIKSRLEEFEYKVEKMSTRHPYDLLVNGNIKIDIKVSNYYLGSSCKYHTFNLEKKYHNCDIFICVGLNETDIPVKILVIPSKYLMGIRQLSVGIKSKYDKFNYKYKYIKEYDNFYKKI